MPSKKPLGERIQAARLRAELSQQSLATKAGVSLSALCKIEQGQAKDPTWSVVCKLAKALKVSLDDWSVT